MSDIANLEELAFDPKMLYLRNGLTVIGYVSEDLGFELFVMEPYYLQVKPTERGNMIEFTAMFPLSGDLFYSIDRNWVYSISNPDERIYGYYTDFLESLKQDNSNHQEDLDVDVGINTESKSKQVLH